MPGGHPEVVGDERRYTDGGPRVTTGPTLGVITILTVPSGLSNVVAARGNMQQAPATAKGGGTTTSCMTTSEIAVSLEELANAIDADHPGASGGGQERDDKDLPHCICSVEVNAIPSSKSRHRCDGG